MTDSEPSGPGKIQSDQSNGTNRRSFLKHATAATVSLLNANLLLAGTESPTAGDPAAEIPWYRKVTRWGQTNITEADPKRYDIGWWRGYWKRTQTQGVIINAGGIVAYYPSFVPFHHAALYLDGRDLFGELCRAAHEDGLAVFARMDSNRAHEELYKVHPDWFTADATGNPYKAGDLYIACVNTPYYDEHIPAILREIAGTYHPEGFTDNSWSGLGRSRICYCVNCREGFRKFSGKEIPGQSDWNDPVYRKWILWNYKRRLDIWDLNNLTTKEAGGSHCIWVGMNSGSVTGQCESFRDYKEICRRAEIIMLDHQARSDAGGFQQNGQTGRLIHGMLGWEKLIPESMAMYQAGDPTFRMAAKPEAEARMWILEGIAGGIQPWWHHVGAYHEDRRMYRTAESIYRWHKAHEEFLVSRIPVATIGVVWSQLNTDFYGRNDAGLLVELPWRGMTQALVRARIPYIPVHADHIDRYADDLSLLVLPNLAAMTVDQVESIKRFVNKGGGLLATGESGLFNEWGDVREDYALADLLGVHIGNSSPFSGEDTRKKWADGDYHTYLRLSPELRAGVDGPKTGNEPAIIGTRHQVLDGFKETDILAFGGMLRPIRTNSGALVPLTFIPEFPIYPPETSWMRVPVTGIPGLVLQTLPGDIRIAFMPADLDRRFARYNLPDHGNLLANLVRWTVKDNIPIRVEGTGLLDCHLYRQPGRLILHVVNLTNAGTWRQPIHEIIPVGPVNVTIRLPEDVGGTKLRLLVSAQDVTIQVSDRSASFSLASVLDHEVIVIS